MTESSRGWTVYCEQDAAETLASLPDAVHDAVIDFLVGFAASSGAAIDAGGPPHGDPTDDANLGFSVAIPDQSVIMEYLVVADIREFRVTTIVPFI